MSSRDIKPKSSKYQRISNELEEPDDSTHLRTPKPTKSPLHKLKKPVSSAPLTKNTHNQHNKHRKSIHQNHSSHPHPRNPINKPLSLSELHRNDISHNLVTVTSIGPNTDSSDSNEETKTDNDECTPLPLTPHTTLTNTHTHSISNRYGYNNHLHLNQKEYKRELVQSLLQKLKIALTFLLHDRSPIWRSDSEDYKENNLSNVNIYAKGNFSAKNVSNNTHKKGISQQSSLKSNTSLYSNESKNGKTVSFQKRCTQYTTSAQLFGGVKKNQSRLNALFRNGYVSEYRALYALWTEWDKYATLMEDGQCVTMENLRFEIAQNQQILEDDCVDFLEAKTITKKNVNSLVAAFNKLRGKVSETENYLSHSGESLRKRLSPNSRTDGATLKVGNKPSTSHSAVMYSSEEELKNVSTRAEMKRWIKTFKSQESERHCCRWSCCCACKFIRACFGESCCDCKSIRNILFAKEDKTLNIPMDLWSWQNVVAAIEDAVFTDGSGEEHQLRHFASVFWQYQIGGKELVNMDVLQIELLVECWFLNNIKEQFFDEIKRKSQNDEQMWDLTVEAEYLMKYIDRLRIHSHIVSRYHLSMDIVQLIVSEYKDNPDSRTSDIYEDAINILSCVELLRSNLTDGPKEFWKIESHFFNKIDNYLSVLICDEKIQQMYVKAFPDFLYEEKQSGVHIEECYSNSIPVQKMGNSSKYSNSRSAIDNNAFYTIASRLQRNDFKSNISKTETTAATEIIRADHGKYKHDWMDKTTDMCCDAGCCENCDCSAKYMSYIHNLDRIYCRIGCLVIFAMLLGCMFILKYYYEHGTEQARDAMFLSLESIGDRTVRIMNAEFWVPQMALSLAIGGLTTGDLLPNASAYTYPNYRFDQFFASFTHIQRTAAIFSVFMYDHDTNTMVGAYRDPDEEQTDGIDNSTVIILSYNGTCRQDRLYDPNLRMRVEIEPYTRMSSRTLNPYLDCSYDPKSNTWYEKGQEIGIGKSQWTEPYVFSETFRGMSYVAPIMWHGKRITFVAEVTTYTLAVAVSGEIPIETLPGGYRNTTKWMIVTPGLNAVASSNNETLIPDCNITACQTNDTMIIASIKYMREVNVTNDTRFTGTLIDSERKYQLSVYPFEMNHVNLHPPHNTSYNEWIVKPLLLNSKSDYQYGYVAIVNDDDFMHDVDLAWYVCWIITGWSIACLIVLMLCNIRYNNLEHRKLGRAGRSGIIQKSESRKLKIAESSIHLFTKQTSKTKSFSNGEIENNGMQSPLVPLKNAKSAVCDININYPIIGDRIKTKNNKYGTVSFVGRANSASVSQRSLMVHILLEQENNKGQVLVPLQDIIYNFGQKLTTDDQKSEESPVPHSSPAPQLPISSRSTIDNKILKGSIALAPLNICDEKDDSLSDHECKPIIAGSNTVKSTAKLRVKMHSSARAKVRLKSDSIAEGSESKHDTDDIRCFCIEQEQFEVIDSSVERFCYLPQKTLIWVTYLLLCVTLIVLVLVWELLTTSATESLFNDVLAKHEWLTIQDRVYSLFGQTNMIADIVTERFYRNDMDLTNSDSLDRFFGNVMQSFILPDRVYAQQNIYITTPNGHFRGAHYAFSENSSQLAAGIKDKSTNNSYHKYLINEKTGIHGSQLLEANSLYDPRCRPWYRDALLYSFEGTYFQAFPNNSYPEWVSAHDSCGRPTNCLLNMDVYNDMWNITVCGSPSDCTENLAWVNASEAHYWLNNNTYKYNGTQHSMVWNRYLFTASDNEQIGLTGSRLIRHPQTGEIIAIVSVDYTLESMSHMLDRQAQNVYDNFSNVNYDNWKAWVFEAKDNYSLIASSDHNVLRPATETEGCYGFLVAVDNQKVPYNVLEHPEWFIRVYSEEIIEVYGIDSLHINASEPQTFTVPYGIPTLEGGIVQYYPGDEANASINWVVLKTMDVSGSFVDDFHITMIGILLVMACVYVLLRQLDYSDKIDFEAANANKKRNKQKMMEDNSDYLSIMTKMKPIVQGAAKATWARLVTKNEAHLNSLGFASLITTEQAKSFLAERGNNHIASENENNAVFRECAWYACAYTKYWKRVQLHYWEFIESNYYDAPVQLLLLGHLFATFLEPSTPTQLKAEGLSSNAMVLLSIAQFVQWLDCMLVGLKRYFEFRIKEPYLTSLFELNYGLFHKYTLRIKHARDTYNNDKSKAFYLTFRGPQCKRYICHAILVGIDLLNFVLMVTIREAPFSYYLPILPLLIIVRNHHVLMFGADFVAAVIYAKNVLFSYFCFILIFAILAMSLYRDTVNEDEFADSFQTITSAFVTGFVYISTSENYAIIYDVIGSEYYDPEQHWLVLSNVVILTIFFAMMGMFCWIPMIIDKFEQAFEESNMKHDQKNKLRKTNAIIAAFVMLDFNGDMDIDQDEFSCLVTSSVLIDKGKLFDAFDRNNNDTLDIYEFVSSLLKQSFRTKIRSTSAHVPQLKFNAWFECNVFRNTEYTIYIFVFLVVPVIGLSVIRGLTHRFNEEAIEDGIKALAALNMIEIHFRCFCYGIKRFWDLLKYPNPNYITAATIKYKTKMQRHGKRVTLYNDMSNNTIRLTSEERNWVQKHLRDIRPLSILEKSTQTLINRIELVLFWFCVLAIIVYKVLFGIQSSNNEAKASQMYGPDEDIDNETMNNRYLLYFVQLAVMIRVFTLIPKNQQLLYIVFKVFPSFVALFAFLGLYIYTWARIGCTLFGDGQADIVLPEIYEPAEDMVATFNSLSYAILALIQLMIGEGWHEVMYYNVIATHQFASIYFIVYITVVSIIIANVFVGLFLADVDELTQQQSHDDIVKHSQLKLRSFEVYAKEKLNKLSYQIQQNKHQNYLMEKQIEHINFILQQQQSVRQRSTSYSVNSE